MRVGFWVTSWGPAVRGGIRAIYFGNFPDGSPEPSFGTFFAMVRLVGNISTGFFFVERRKLHLLLRKEFISTLTFFLRFVD